MSRRFRFILTLVFAAGFLITAPLVLFYTAGYRYDRGKNRLLKTGLIQTDSIPDGATVFLDGADTGRVTPSPLTRLSPEEYRVRFEKAGYLPWEKTVEVWSGTTAFVTDAALIADAPVSTLAATATRLPTFSPDGTMLAYLTADETETSLHWSSFIDTGIARDANVRVPAATDTDAEIIWSPGSDRIMLIGHAATGDRVVTIDARTVGATPVEAKLPAGRYAASWSADGKTAVLVSSGGILLADAANGRITGPLEAAVSAAALIGNDLYVLRPVPDAVQLEVRTPVVGAASRSLTELPTGTYRFLDVTGPLLVVTDLLRGKLFVIDPDDGSIVDRLDATNVRWHDAGATARLLAWNDYEITMLDPAVPERRLVTRLGARIDACAWHPSGLSVFYLADGEPYAVDLDGRDPKNVAAMAPNRTFSVFAVDADAETLRFVDSAGLYARPF